MSEKPKKGAKLLAFWLFGTVMVVFAAITAYILFIGRMAGSITAMMAIKSGFPIWGVTALAAVIIYAGYYFYNKNKN
ncbi:MAG: hypothetical protein DRJ03_18965 [Chloroflexi bacterium]|nr:MAG: hypothetical protein B6I35_01195 [Anaerolineaceae bacterium 4572_32.2]RLC82041.1 MAG: hypothetical protein DRI81_00840 [Chloroflexota bacterium]RLC82482.1 MAG: hypothetical protein DRJ03_18965 [Chloroflexota bacterium]HEY72471.1 hypothetical protein [Thermoflexia bacterium]